MTNPYDLKLSSFSKVLRDEEGQVFQGKWQEYFQNNQPITLEIGTGYGGFALQYLQEFTHENFIGLDYRFKRSLSFVKKLEKLSASYAFLRAGAQSLPLFFKKGELHKVFLLFSDPWPKKRHEKKRLVQESFFKILSPLLAQGALVFIKTDNDLYFDFMLKQEFHGFRTLFMSKDLHAESSLRKEFLLLTDFEKIFLNQKIPIKGLLLEKK